MGSESLSLKQAPWKEQGGGRGGRRLGPLLGAHGVGGDVPGSSLLTHSRVPSPSACL